MPTPELMTERMKVVLQPMTPGIYAGQLTMFQSEFGLYCRLSDAEAALQSALNDKEAEIERLKALYEARELEAHQLSERIIRLSPDADRYRKLRRGQHWSVINGIGDTLRAESLDAAIDAMNGDAS